MSHLLLTHIAALSLLKTLVLMAASAWGKVFLSAGSNGDAKIVSNLFRTGADGYIRSVGTEASLYLSLH